MRHDEEYDITRAFKRIEDELIASMIRNMDSHRAEEDDEGILWSQWQAEQLKALEKYKLRNQKKYSKQFRSLNKRVEELIKIAHNTGNMEQEIAILEAIKNGFSGYKRVSGSSLQGEFFQMNERKLEALIEATINDMQKAETAVLRMANDKYRKIIFDAQVYANTGAGTYEKAVDMVAKDMLAAGLNCVEYANGARHTLADYADMAIRTASKRAYLQGEGQKRQEWGIATVIMNKRGNPCPKCLPFCGKVLIDDVWSGGSRKDGDYPLMSYAISKGLYHPRCKDSHTTYFSGISTADDTWTKEELEAIGQNAKREAKQQYAERQAEKFGRLAEYSLDEENQKIYMHRMNKWEEVLENNENDSKIEPKLFIDGAELNNFFYIDNPSQKGLLARKNSKYGKWKQSITSDEMDAMAWYTGDGYGDINNYWRKAKDWESIDATSVKEASDKLDSLISRFELKENIVVQRGVSENSLYRLLDQYEIDENLNELVGKKLLDSGYGSSTALYGNGVATSKSVIYEIMVPAGIGRGAYINEFAGLFKDAEYEFLLKRDFSGTITEVIEDETIGKTIVKVVMDVE